MTIIPIENAIFENAPIGLMYSEQRVIIRANQRCAAMFGFAVKDIEGQSLAALYPTRDDYNLTGQHWSKELREHGQYSDERIMRRKGNDLFWCRVRGQAIDVQAPLARAVWSFADLSTARPVAPLSRRARQVGMLLVEGLTAKEIARRLEISPRTVHAHKTRLLTHFSARNSIELVKALTSMPS
jgi:PAS domain S-box-containing protein